MTDRPVAGHDVVDSPLGPITLVADADGALCGLYFPEHRHGPSAEAVGPRQAGMLNEVAHQLDEYFHEGRRRFDVVVAPPGTPSAFRREVWAHLATIPYGETVSYGELAVRLGRPGAARAVGLANGANPVSIIVPCHRVIGASGSLTGYGGGMARKRALLDHEAAEARLRLF